MFNFSLQSGDLSKSCTGCAWEEGAWYMSKYFLPKLLIVFWIIIEHFHQEHWVVKFQDTQPPASLIINKWFQFLLLREHWFYELIRTTIHPWLLCVLFLEKLLDLTLLGRALVSMETNPPFLHPLRPRLMTLASLIAQLLQNLPAMQETQVWFLGWEDPLEKGLTTHSSILGLPLWLSW